MVKVFQRRHSWFPLSVFLGTLLLTALSSYYAASAAKAKIQARFDKEVQRTQSEIQNRLQTYIALLYGGSGLFAASEQVSRQEFYTYIKRLELKKQYPGIQGIGFSVRVRPHQVAALVAQMRKQEFQNFSVFPKVPTRDEYHAIIYLEPLEDRNQAAIGFDMFSEPNRREAMERARDTGQAAASGRVTLVQETDKNKQAGFLIYLPVYENGRVTNNVIERRAALKGFVYSPFRAKDLLTAIFNQKNRPMVDFQVYDGTQLHRENLLYRSKTSNLTTVSPLLQLKALKSFKVAGQTWSLVFEPRPELIQDSEIKYISLIAMGGLILSLILWKMTRSLVDAHQATEQTARQLRQSETRFRTLVEQAPLSIQIFAANGTMLEANRAWEQMWGSLEADSHNYNVFKDEHLPGKGLKLAVQRALKGEVTVLLPMLYKPNIINSQSVSKIDAPKWIRGLIYPVKDEAGAIREVVLLQEDITEIKLAQEEIVQLNNQLEQRVIERTAQLEVANRELEAFCYSISHDLRTPLRSIDGFSQVLLEDYSQQLDIIGQDYLTRVCKATHRMGELIDDLLYLSRVTRSEMSWEPTNLSALAMTIAEELQATNRERQVDFAIESGLVVNADKKLMRIVLENLMGNAWKFSAKQSRARIEIGLIKCEDSQTYFVRDNGVGFDMAYANKLFGAFQRLHPATEFEGTGIGLATVKRIIHRHGGRIWAQGEVGIGATFYFIL